MLVNSNNWKQTFARNDQFGVRNNGLWHKLQGKCIEGCYVSKNRAPHRATVFIIATSDMDTRGRELVWQRNATAAAPAKLVLPMDDGLLSGSWRRKRMEHGQQKSQPPVESYFVGQQMPTILIKALQHVMHLLPGNPLKLQPPP